MQQHTEYDVAIVGGGLAGLSAAIELSKREHSVILFEKEKYPFHKVCGEYISLESKEFLEELGLNFGQLKPPIIDTLLLTAPNGKSFTTKLPLGGFGISRYKLDCLLSEIAKKNGVQLLEQTKVNDINFDEKFHVHFNSRINEAKEISANLCCAAYGKRSNLDIKWNRKFINAADKKLENFVGVKYHIKTDWPENLIGLHNFENGYCGISKIEEDKYCLCYMTHAKQLKNSGNNIRQLEENILYQNPHLKKIFQESEICQTFPVTISQISFQKKTQVENKMLMIGDAAGMITPVCGNGMSIALHTGKIAASFMHHFLTGKITRTEMEENYAKEWKQQFASRLRTGRVLQGFFGSKTLSNFFVQSFKTFPFLAAPLVRMTHGKSF